MKLKYLLLSLLLLLVTFSCSKNSNSSEFIEKVTGRYLYNSDEVIKIYFNDNELFMEWRGAKTIKPLKINETTFFVKEMNEKIQFLTNPENQKDYIVLIPKEKNKVVEFNFIKLNDTEKVPSEYLINNEFQKALEGYLAIQKNDSLDKAIIESDFNRLGYKKLRETNYEKSLNIFKINIALYPNSSNVYDSYAEALMKSGDTALAIINYKKSLVLDSGNKRAKNNIEKLTNKN